MTYHILRNGEQAGPYPEAHVRQLLAAGEIQGSDLGWREGLTDWAPLRSLILMPAAISADSPTPPPYVGPNAARSRSSPMGAGTKRLIALGAVGGVLVMVGVIFFFVILFKQNKSAQDYVDNYVAHIAPAWSADELLRRVPPQYRDKFPTATTQALFKKLSGLGHLKHAEPSTANTTVQTTTSAGKRTVATVIAHASFDNGNATFIFYLVQVEGQWTVIGFHVRSPIFDK